MKHNGNGSAGIIVIGSSYAGNPAAKVLVSVNGTHFLVLGTSVESSLDDVASYCEDHYPGLLANADANEHYIDAMFEHRPACACSSADDACEACKTYAANKAAEDLIQCDRNNWLYADEVQVVENPSRKLLLSLQKANG